MFSHLDHQGLHCSYSHFQSLSVLLSKLPIWGYFLEPVPFSVLKQRKSEHRSSHSQNILQNFKLVVRCQPHDSCWQIRFSSLRVQLVMLMGWTALLQKHVKMVRSALVKRKVKIFTHSSILKCLNMFFDKSNSSILPLHIK